MMMQRFFNSIRKGRKQSKHLTMKKNASFTIVVFLLAMLYSSCNKNNNLTSDLEGRFKREVTNIESIKYGTSFGMCFGYCSKSITITNSVVDYEAYSYQGEEDFPTIYLSETIEEKEWNNLVGKINFNNFSLLDESIGCPDCADGGAEWIEIKMGDEVHRVIFEYGNEPRGVKGYIDELKILFKSFEE